MKGNFQLTYPEFFQLLRTLIIFLMRLHFAENLNCLLKDRKEYVQRQRNEPTEHNSVFSFKIF